MLRFARIGAACVLAALAGAAPLAARAAATDWTGDQRAAVRIVTATDSVHGDTLDAGVEFRYPAGWHGYWRTPGDAGIAPIFNWSASQNVAGTTVSWPAPSRLVIAGLQNSVYTGDFILPVKIRLAHPDQPTHLALTIDYATCSNVCVPEHAELSLTLPAGTGTGAASAEAAAIAAAARSVPATAAQAGISVVRNDLEPTKTGEHLRVELRSAGAAFQSPDLFVEGAGAGLPAAPRVQLSDQGHRAQLDVDLPRPDPQATVHAPLQLTVVDGARAATFAGPSASTPPGGTQNIALILALALLGGLVLNFMPCVLPVLSIKVFSLVKSAGAERAAARRVALATASGIVVSFLLLAAALSALKLAGATLGWGIQFQQPWFLAGMAVMTTLFAASFFDWLPIGLPQVFARFGAGNAQRAPLVEAFVSGMLATLLATPCSAPFVGTVVGFALARNPIDIVAVLAALGIGMALPFIVLAVVPALARWLPRPGAWMVRLRQVMGLLLLGTSIWLLASLLKVAGATIAAIVAVMLTGLLGLRGFVSAAQGARANRWSGIATAVLAVGTIALASVPVSIAPARTDKPGEWQAFDPNAIAPLVASGKTVLVDVTASWCLTCKVNELAVLDTAPVRSRLASNNVVRMRADWSRYNPQIAGYVQSFGRFGIPLDVVYGPRQPQGHLLPELLQTATLFQALDGASNDGGGTPRTRGATDGT
ncbi:protein-disulfide reductase DsbD family protein [Paraburkholderia sp. SOS3]|uniref:protein-disulfide reductase DsbD family protein n=1 Tax=Paraburkholderia sp. SOS3 TaxID=1926494 RepID=UPI0009477F47|nr:protein-disulfide reductase DsbD domain-containing protein [Paraburkholderia sp. SOS3]APR35120.1 hypothetical protein BTO02_06415 [Paraburkholderia sp. SOS3]